MNVPISSNKPMTVQQKNYNLSHHLYFMCCLCRRKKLPGIVFFKNRQFSEVDISRMVEDRNFSIEHMCFQKYENIFLSNINTFLVISKIKKCTFLEPPNPFLINDFKSTPEIKDNGPLQVVYNLF